MRRIVSVAGIISSILAVNNANAAEKSNSVEERLNSLEKEISELKKENLEIKDNKAKTYSFAPSVQNLRFYGRLHIDARWYDEKDGTHNRDSGHDEIEIKRARFGLYGDLNDYVGFYFEMNFAYDNAGIGEAWIKYKINNNLDFKLGQITEPFLHEQLISSNYMPMIDYALGSNFEEYYTTGLMMETNYKNASFHFGTFGESTRESRERKDDSKYAFIGRLGYAPLITDNSVVHIAVAGRYKKFDNRIDNSTDKLEALETTKSYAGEIGLRHKSNYLFAEYVKSNLDYNEVDDATVTDYDGADFNIDGFYVIYSYFLTGEQKPYSKKNNLFFGGPDVKKPFRNGGLGAFELTARYVELDLNDYDSEKQQELNGGITQEFTGGINWYLYNNVRFMFNYSRVQINDDETIDTGIKDYEYDKYVIRSQVNF